MSKNRIFAVKSLGTVLRLIETIPNSEDGEYALYVPKSDLENFSANSLCAVILIRFEDEPGYIPEFAKEKNLGVICDVWLAKDVVKHRREQSIKASDEDLVEALKFFLDNDSFWDLSKAKKT